MTDVVDAVAARVASDEDADDILRSVVSLLAAQPGVVWAGVAFVEGDSLVLGPAAGAPDEASRTRVPVLYDSDPVAELWIDGTARNATLQAVSDLISDVCLVGWDTGGEPWPAGD